MLKDKRLGLALIIAGVFANNFVYLNDIFYEAIQGRPGPIYSHWIFFGWLAATGTVVAVIVIAIGVIILWRSQARGDTE